MSGESAVAVVFVMLQFGLLLAIASAFFWSPFGTRLWPRIVGSVVGASGFIPIVAGALEFQAVNARPASVLPLPTDEAQLVTSGIWRYVRHPLYLGVLLVAVGLCVCHQNWPPFVLWAALLLVLLGKARFEESLLTTAFPSQYPLYREQTSMLVPLPCCCRYSGSLPDGDTAGCGTKEAGSASVTPQHLGP